jgi:hypothetical protein
MSNPTRNKTIIYSYAALQFLRYPVLTKAGETSATLQIFKEADLALFLTQPTVCLDMVLHATFFLMF